MIPRYVLKEILNTYLIIVDIILKIFLNLLGIILYKICENITYEILLILHILTSCTYYYNITVFCLIWFKNMTSCKFFFNKLTNWFTLGLLLEMILILQRFKKTNSWNIWLTILNKTCLINNYSKMHCSYLRLQIQHHRFHNIYIFIIYYFIDFYLNGLRRKLH